MGSARFVDARALFVVSGYSVGMRQLCGERMLGNEDVVCGKRAHSSAVEHEAYVPGEGRYTWYVDRVGLELLRTALLKA